MEFITKVTTQLLFLQTKQMTGKTTGNFSLLEDAHSTVKAKSQVSYYSILPNPVSTVCDVFSNKILPSILGGKWVNDNNLHCSEGLLDSLNHNI